MLAGKYQAESTMPAFPGQGGHVLEPRGPLLGGEGERHELAAQANHIVAAGGDSVRMAAQQVGDLRGGPAVGDELYLDSGILLQQKLLQPGGAFRLFARISGD